MKTAIWDLFCAALGLAIVMCLGGTGLVFWVSIGLAWFSGALVVFGMVGIRDYYRDATLVAWENRNEN